MLAQAAIAGGADPDSVSPRAHSRVVWTPAGLAKKANEDWKWLRIGGELRARVESPTGLNFLQHDDDSYLFTRLRLNTGLTATNWLKFFGEWQDVRGIGYDAPVPGSITNRLDMRQAYSELGSAEGSGWSLRAGRQGLRYGKGRLVSDPDWGNYGQTFDAVRLVIASRKLRIDAFGGSVVVPRDRTFDRSDTSRMFYGLYGSVETWGPSVRLEPYLLLKSNVREKNELGKTGALDLYTTGIRTAGVWREALDWEAEMAYQSGRLAGSSVRAFGGVWALGLRTGDRPFEPRVSVGLTFGSGDSNLRDGKRNTFDTLYPSTHMRNGLTDRIGWANIIDAVLQTDWKFSKNCRLSAGGHDFHLATIADALYSKSGTPLFRNPNASSKHIGSEAFVTIERQVGRAVSLGSGYAHLFRGRFLRESGRGSASQPYVFVTHRF